MSKEHNRCRWQSNGECRNPPATQESFGTILRPSTTCRKTVILIRPFRIDTAHSVELCDIVVSEGWNQESIE